MFQPFYHSLIRKCVIGFGTLFDDISVIRRAADGVEVQRLKVPIAYGPKESWLARIAQNPQFTKSIQITLPRMAFAITNMTYDAARKLPSMNRRVRQNVAGQAKHQFVEVPYNIDMSLYVLVKSIEDGTQILEQVLPYFTPDYTITIHTIPEMGLTQDVPIIYGGMSMEDTYEDNFTERRAIIWTLNFTVKAAFYGPVTRKSVIVKAVVDNYATPTGSPMQPAGRVVTENNEFLVLEDNSGRILLETDDYGLTTSTHASRVTITPNPPTAQPGDDFGFTTVIQHFEDGKQFNPLTLEDEDVNTDE